MARMPTYFLSHGGGPWPWIDEMRPAFAPLEQALAAIPGQLPEPPKAILMISAHWEAREVQVMHHAHPPMVYDYGGFPAHSYEIRYPAPGDPVLAARVADMIAAAGIEVALDDVRGFDHGAFVPAYVMYPRAEVPMVQVSIREDYDPAGHFELGRALAPLRDAGVLILGSGLSYHNLRRFGTGAREASEAFDGWLGAVLDGPAEARTAALLDWESAPHARAAHPREDHLVPLFVALGAAQGAPATRIYHQEKLFGGVTASSWRFG